MKNEVTKCKTNPNGVHEYVTDTVNGEHCKHCGLLRSTLEPVNIQLEKDEHGNHLSPFSAEFRKERIENTAGEIASRIQEGEKKQKQISDEVYQRILKETNSKAALVITFPNVIQGTQFMLTDFHISAVNVDYKTFPAVLAVVIDALLGRLGGIMNFRSDKKGGDEPPAPTAV